MYTLVRHVCPFTAVPHIGCWTDPLMLPSQLDTCLPRIDVPVYIQRVVAGLADADEIKGASGGVRLRLSQQLTDTLHAP